MKYQVNLTASPIYFTAALMTALSLLSEGRSRRRGQQQTVWIATDMVKVQDAQDNIMLLSTLKEKAGGLDFCRSFVGFCRLKCSHIIHYTQYSKLIYLHLLPELFCKDFLSLIKTNTVDSHLLSSEINAVKLISFQF